MLTGWLSTDRAVHQSLIVSGVRRFTCGTRAPLSMKQEEVRLRHSLQIHRADHGVRIADTAGPVAEPEVVLVRNYLGELRERAGPRG